MKAEHRHAECCRRLTLHRVEIGTVAPAIPASTRTSARQRKFDAMTGWGDSAMPSPANRGAPHGPGRGVAQKRLDNLDFGFTI